MDDGAPAPTRNSNLSRLPGPSYILESIIPKNGNKYRGETALDDGDEEGYRDHPNNLNSRRRRRSGSDEAAAAQRWFHEPRPADCSSGEFQLSGHDYEHDVIAPGLPIVLAHARGFTMATEFAMLEGGDVYDMGIESQPNGAVFETFQDFRPTAQTGMMGDENQLRGLPPGISGMAALGGAVYPPLVTPHPGHLDPHSHPHARTAAPQHDGPHGHQPQTPHQKGHHAYPPPPPQSVVFYDAAYAQENGNGGYQM